MKHRMTFWIVTFRATPIRLALLLLCALVPWQATAQVHDLYGESYALVIGIDEYSHSDWPDLPFPRKDAAAVGELLRDQGFEVVALYDHQATRAGIISTLEDRIAPRLRPEDRVVVFFSGHGSTRSFGGRSYGYLVPHDGTASSSTWLSMTTLREMSQKLGTAKHQLFILDSCFGGSFAVKGGSSTISRDHPHYIREVTRRPARQFLTAGGEDQQVRAAGPHGYSHFTGYLLEALEEGLAETDGDGYITALELAQYLQTRAANRDQTPGFGDLSGHGLGTLVFRAPDAPARYREPTPDRPSVASGARLRLKGLEPDVTNQPPSCESSYACFSQGRKYFLGSAEVAQDYGRAAVSFFHACRLGEPAACTGLAHLYERALGVDEDLQRARSLYAQGCDGGDSMGCLGLGQLYHLGRGVEQDYVRARELYRRACEEGEAGACHNLGLLYESGNGVTPDGARARELFSRACDDGQANSCLELGHVYEGKGVSKDDERAAEFYRRGCEAGNATACVNWGVFLGKGWGVPQDSLQARELFRRACDAGELDGCRNLGVLYVQGQGVEPDIARARALFRFTCDKGDEASCEFLAKLDDDGGS